MLLKINILYVARTVQVTYARAIKFKAQCCAASWSQQHSTTHAAAAVTIFSVCVVYLNTNIHIQYNTYK